MDGPEHIRIQAEQLLTGRLQQAASILKIKKPHSQYSTNAAIFVFLQNSPIRNGALMKPDAKTPVTAPPRAAFPQSAAGRQGSVLNWLNGQNTSIALPLMRLYGTKPTSANRLSSELLRLSPMTKTVPSGTVAFGCDYRCSFPYL